MQLNGLEVGARLRKTKVKKSETTTTIISCKPPVFTDIVALIHQLSTQFISHHPYILITTPTSPSTMLMLH
jgi:hypothetical protein